MLVSKILKRKDLIDYSVESIEYNSKNVNSKSIFFAIKGSKDDGSKYIDDCLNKGCRTIITNNLEAYNKYKKIKGINIIHYKNINRKMAYVAKNFYKDVSKKLYLIGITGTNGKTSTSSLVYKYLRKMNIKATLIGTNGVYINDNYYEEKNTTPNIIDLYKYLYLSYKENIKYVIMEVSSHAIKLDRILGLNYKIKCLTNISLDHLDFHKNFDNYRKTKEKWLKSDKKTIFYLQNCLSEKINLNSWVNIKKNKFESKNWEELCIKTLSKNINWTNIELFSNKCGSYGIYKTNLIGDYNMQNIVLFLSIIKCMKKLNLFYLKKFFNSHISIDGRMNIYYEKERYFVIDFAHTPDGIQSVMNVFKDLNMNIISVCGCGGNRDKTKRPIMAKILSDNSKYTIFTSDNPRNENPLDIVNDMLQGVDNNNVFVEVDRFNAIKKAYELSSSAEVILILGKGNENKQYIMDKEIKVSDYELLERLLGE